MTPPSPSPHLDAIRASIRGASGEFACGGHIPFTQALTFRVGEHKPIVLRPAGSDLNRDLIQSARQRERAAKQLRKLCQPAPFGAGTATRVDRAVRDADQLNARDGGFTFSGFDLERSGILEEVRAKLAPLDPNPIVAELYALNIYGPGGHFVPHKDTPRGNSMLGTLVLNLPTEFFGGTLCVSHRGLEQRFFEHLSYSMHDREDRLEWAAFFGDVDHEIRPVSGGIRVTLTWILRRSHAALPPAPEPGSRVEHLSWALRDAVADKAFFPEGARLGVPCVHMYSRGVDAPVVLHALTPETALGLAGRDQQVALAAIDAGLEVQLLPLLAEVCAEEVWTLTRFMTKKEAALFQRERMDSADIEEHIPICSAPVWVSAVVDAWLMPEPKLERERAERPLPDLPALGFLGEPEYSSTGYFGNEGGPDEFYAYAALVITVPKRGKR